MSETQTLTAARTPTVYFIDDSATMREVIKIAFRKENIHVVTCPDAATALAQFGESAPDAVITDVIMPDKDGYEVCQFIKQHDRFGATPVILMSGVVNKAVAEKAMAVKADELIRKPFQPQDLIARVKNLLYPKRAGVIASEVSAGDSGDAPRASSQVLTSLFSASPAPAAPAATSPRASFAPAAPAAPRVSAPAPPPRVAPPAAAAPSAEVQKLRNEILRLEMLVKRLQAELEAQHQYCAALEAHFKTVQDT
ncbi:MAG TPA: response regulator [Candidatus Acidoferrales bacterium]|nr:response regulator [Candidatus Acidoferrales bacterium]